MPASTSDLPVYRYRAFISYSHADARVAAWLHGALERFRMPARLVGQPGSHGEVPRRLLPVFMDRNELAASGSLDSELEAALAGSRFLIVVCTPRTVQSRWVDEEIRRFKLLHGEDRVLALIADGEPYASAIPGREAEECFPACLRFRLGADGQRSDRPAEPLAADLRERGDGKRLALLKLIAALAGTRLDDLVQREAQRRNRRLATLAAASFAGMLLTGGLAFYAYRQQIEAERQTATANAAVDYMVGTFEAINPATEKPSKVSVLDLLKRNGARLDSDLVRQPAIRARLLDTIGRVYINVGLYQQADRALAPAEPMLHQLGRDGAPAMLTLAMARLYLGNLRGADEAVDAARSVLGPADQALALRARAADVSGTIHKATGDQQEALRNYNEAEALYRQLGAIKPETRAKLQTNRGVLLTDMGQYAAADRSLLGANALYLRTLGPHHQTTGLSWNALAYNALAAGRPAEAAQRMAKAMAIFDRVLDSDSTVLAGALAQRGEIEQLLGEPRAAKASIEQALSIYRKRLGPWHFQIGISLVALAMVEAELKNYGASLADFSAAQIQYDKGYGGLHANHGDLLVNRGLVLAKAGRPAEARRDCARGLAILDEKLGKGADYTKALAAKCSAISARASGDRRAAPRL